MHHGFIIKNSVNRRLIILFLGWGMDSTPFKDELAGMYCGYDILAVWDYADKKPIPANTIAQYDEICVIAWSMGVAYAPDAVRPFADAITKMIAINGTPTPVDDKTGIPVAIYEGTLNNMDERNLQKFYRRVCGSAERYKHFCVGMPKRALPELIDELKLMSDVTTSTKPSPYTLAIVSADDAIFPSVNQTEAWNNAGVEIERIDGPHLPDFRSLISRHLINKELVRKRFTAASATYEDNTPAQLTIAHNLVMLFLNHRNMCTSLEEVLEIGPGSGTLTRGLLEVLPPESHLTLWDITLGNVPQSPRIDFIQADAEMMVRQTENEKFDIIFSASTIQWFNSLTSFMPHASRVLKPGGLMCVSSFVKGNLPEIAETFGTSLQLPDENQWRTLVSHDFDIIECKTDNIVLPFDSPRSLLEHMKLSGVNAVSDSQASMSKIRAFLSSTDAQMKLTYKPILFILRKK